MFEDMINLPLYMLMLQIMYYEYYISRKSSSINSKNKIYTVRCKSGKHIHRAIFTLQQLIMHDFRHIFQPKS